MERVRGRHWCRLRTALSTASREAAIGFPVVFKISLDGSASRADSNHLRPRNGGARRHDNPQLVGCQCLFADRAGSAPHRLSGIPPAPTPQIGQVCSRVRCPVSSMRAAPDITPTAGGNFTYALTCGGQESGFATLAVNNNSSLQIEPPSMAALQATVSQDHMSLDLTAFGGTDTVHVVDRTRRHRAPPGSRSNETETMASSSGTPQQFGKYSLVVEVEDYFQAESAAAAACYQSPLMSCLDSIF